MAEETKKAPVHVGTMVILKTPRYRLWNPKTGKKMVPWDQIAFDPAKFKLCPHGHFHFDALFKQIQDEGGIWLESVGQKDRVGTEIFAGDILETSYKGTQIRGVIAWAAKTMQYAMRGKVAKELAPKDGVLDIFESEEGRPTIIGNVFQHSHLLPK